MADCIFCKIASGQISTNKVYEDDKVLAFNDINPQAPIHILVVPKEHISSMNDIDENNYDIIGYIHYIIGKIVKEKNIDKDGYRIVNNCGKNGGQEVPHLHFHILAGRKMQWPPG